MLNGISLVIQDYQAFDEAVEDNCLDVFLQLASATKTSEATVTLGVSF